MMAVFALVAGCGQIENTTMGEPEDDQGDVAFADTSAYDDRSPWDAAMPTGSLAVVAAANWTDPVGSLASIDLGDLTAADTALITTDGTDVVITSFGGRVYVLNRFGADTVQVIDPKDFSVVANYSVGAGSNPQDIVVRSDEKAYLTRLDAHNDAANDDDLLIINPLTGDLMTSIDLKAYAADDGDRLARAAQMVAVDTTLYVLLQDLPSNLLESADQPGKIVVIDMETDAVTGTIELDGRNPSDITYSPVTGKIYVANTGVFDNFVTDVNDPYGGIEVVDPASMQSEGIVVDDADFGNYLMGIRLAADRGYTIVGGFQIASFDITSYDVLSANLYMSAGMFVPDIAVDPRGRVLLTERDAANSGVVVMDGVSGDVLAGPIDVGALPASITFVEVSTE
jgi:DNA-binding beta-propeller fold protein YncE